MRSLRKITQSSTVKCLLTFMLLMSAATLAWADLESGMEDLQTKIFNISTPLAIIFLIIAAWQKALGNNMLFFASLVGTVIMFSAPQIVDFIKTAFGG